MASRKIEVKDILDQWIAPDHRYFKLQGDDNAVYILRHDSTSGDWEMVFYTFAERSFGSKLE
jgi:hypothetical protein